MKIIRCFIISSLCSLLLTGCWDRNEINEYAFWIGTALDLTDSGKLEKSAQIAIPAEFKTLKGGGGKGERANIVVSATGSSIVDLIQQIQEKLPRRIFLGHRRSIFIGEKLAHNGLVDIMDQFTRNPDTRMRTDIFVVNDGKGKDVLKINSPFNQFSAIVAVHQDRYCRLGDTSLRDFLLDAGRDGIRPSMPMIDIAPMNKLEENKIIEVRAVAIFNKDLKMVGKVRDRESLELFWVKGVLKNQYVSEETGEGTLSLYVSNLRRTFRTAIEGDKLKVRVKLIGNARVVENNTPIDLSVSSQRIHTERKFNKIKAKQIEATIRKIQTDYGQDVFGFGEEFHREHPKQWKKLKAQWDQKFPTIEVTVDVGIKIKSTGDIRKRIPRIGARE
ncbi:Ger(x)C family spore germination protein [Paenibacillus sp. JDR-2]|uniref:Ger(x)C family spore germination protein n=1 Tax=Paenibacillus sp. (strain JDR-2) TaxID=324057 RepID=UPI0001663C67|nr:Ger(x)C family spore germination protein [Paenibacillus sp. JDR-2]ACT01690.1 germination protein, Ger(x)C family [Paenibacillus sp. JDR-2]